MREELPRGVRMLQGEAPPGRAPEARSERPRHSSELWRLKRRPASHSFRERVSVPPVPCYEGFLVDRVVTRAAAWGIGATLGLGAPIWSGSRRLAHFDAALAAYTAAVLFAAFGLTYRYAVWLQRPPTAMLWRRGWQAFLRRGW